MTGLSKQRTIEEAVTSAYASNFSLSLDAKQMAFLIGIFTFMKQNHEPTLTVGNLQNIFTRINTLIFGEDETVDRRSSTAIAHLREQGFIAKMGVDGGSQYAISSLGRAVGQHWEREDLLTQQSLVLYTSHIRVVLGGIRDAAIQGGDDRTWAEEICLPLREIVPEIINSIDRRQQGMSLAQKNIEQQISAKIRAKWLDALEVCEEMLTTTGTALDELHKVMLSEADLILSVLDEIGDIAVAAGQHQSGDAVGSIQTQMETIRQWSNSSHEDWSKYYRDVHDFIRLHVRADPKRQAAHRVKDAILYLSSCPWTFTVPNPERHVRLKEGEFSRPILPVVITGRASRAVVEESKPIDHSLLNAIKQEIAVRLDATGKASLVDILQKFLPDLDDGELYRVAGELVSLLVLQGFPISRLDLDWTRLDGSIEVQDLTVITRHGTERI